MNDNIATINGTKVMSFSDIRRFHDFAPKSLENRVYYNKDKFVEGEHFMKMSYREYMNSCGEKCDNGGNVTVFTKEGYDLLMDCCKVPVEDRTLAYKAFAVEVEAKAEQIPEVNVVSMYERILHEITMMRKEMAQILAMPQPQTVVAPLAIEEVQPQTVVELPTDRLFTMEESQYFWKNSEAWFNKVYDAIAEVAEAGSYRSKNHILSMAYHWLNRNYGVVWDEEKKALYTCLGRTKKSTLEIAYFMERTKPTYEGLTVIAIRSLLPNHKEEIVEYKPELPHYTVTSTDDIVNAMVEIAKYCNNNSRNQAVLYRSLFSYIANKKYDNEINWTYYENKYKRDHMVFSGNVSKIKLLEYQKVADMVYAVFDEWAQYFMKGGKKKCTQ